MRSDGRFALVFKRGLGDCPAGCTDNYYSYFDTDASCTPTQAGTCHPVWQQDCIAYEGGQPMWGHPVPAAPTEQCALDAAPQDIAGSHRMHAEGQLALCKSPDSIDVKVVEIDGCVELVVDQATPSSPTGTAYIAGLGEPLLERPIPITIRRRAGEGTRQDPAVCVEGSTAQLSFDLEGWAHGSIDVFEMLEDPSCKSYCKGAINLKLSAVSP